ncbi:MAG TPA: DJ-1/PfpI family protein [Kofleriaceae bacterium]|nr:DJ-1/PfpI family protein [Kofleriaceae bacterium]
MRSPSRRVWFLVVPGSDLLDLSGPWEVLGHANDILGHVAYERELRGPGGPTAQTRHGLVVTGIRPLPANASRLPDIAIVAGGSPRAPLPAAEERLATWLCRYHRRIPTLVSICTGAFILGKAGALDGHRATTHWRFRGALPVIGRFYRLDMLAARWSADFKVRSAGSSPWMTLAGRARAVHSLV